MSQGQPRLKIGLIIGVKFYVKGQPRFTKTKIVLGIRVYVNRQPRIKLVLC